MDENKLIEEQIDEVEVIVVSEETVVSAEDGAVNLQIQEEITDVGVSEDKPFIISVEEGSVDPSLRVVADHSPYLPNQHTIGAITGLREELDEIERLKPVYSDGVNQANYYMWEDENLSKENRNGYFVSVHQHDHKIRICSAAEDEFGVTVSSAGFIGGQNEVLRNESYNLVVHSGVVGVRCETDVAAGDYVTSNNYGVAQKTDGTYGYLVTGLCNIDGVNHAVISFTMPTTQMQRFAETAHDIQERMDGAEINIATAISVANAAYNKAKNAEVSVENNNAQIGNQLGGVSDKLDSIQGDIDELGGIISIAGSVAEQAKNDAIETRTQALNANRETNAFINGLIDALDPINEWTDDMGANWREYLAKYIKDGVPTKSEIYDLDGKLQDHTLAINKNAEGLEIIASQIDMYSVGEYSQSYGLHLGDAWNILKVGMIYIPTSVVHAESYEYITVDEWNGGTDKDTSKIYYAKDTESYWYSIITLGENNEPSYEWIERELIYADGSPLILDKQEFTRGYYYTWNGAYWVESAHPLVYFSAAYPIANNNCIYWYRDTYEALDYDGVMYEAFGLYKWDGAAWQKVNILSGNVTNRATSALIQTATEVAANVTNSRGWLAHMGVKIEEDGAIVDSVASAVVNTGYNLEGGIYKNEDELRNTAPRLTGAYYAVGDIAPYDIYTWNENKMDFNKELLFYDGANIMKLNIASIITSANQSDSTIALNANKINFNGVATFTTDEGGITIIQGGGIETGYIASYDFRGSRWIDDQGKLIHNITKGILLDLSNGSILSPNFTLTSDGNATLRGTIHASAGSIAGFNIKSDGVGGGYIGFDQTSLTGQYSFKEGIYVSPYGIGVGNGTFILTSYGQCTIAGKFNVNIKKNNATQIVGYMGAAEGETTEGVTTYGVAMSTQDEVITANSTFPYMIVTTAGARMSCGTNSVYAAPTGVYVAGNLNLSQASVTGMKITFG